MLIWGQIFVFHIKLVVAGGHPDLRGHLLRGARLPPWNPHRHLPGGAGLQPGGQAEVSSWSPHGDNVDSNV